MYKTKLEQLIVISIVIIIFFVISTIEYHDLINNTL
jgi:hypothetical protein